MPKSPTDARDVDIYEALERLSQQVAVLTDAVDRVVDELQWRNNERRGGRQSIPPLTPLHSMPSDPTTDDWQLNRVHRDAQTAQTAAVDSQHTRSVDQLVREVADLTQYVAALILLGQLGDEPELQESYALLLEWASQEFDPEILREAIPESIVAALATESAGIPPRNADSQPVDPRGGEPLTLSQIMAAMLLVTSDSYVSEMEEVYDGLLSWAHAEFNPDALRASLPQFFEDEEPTAVEAIVPSTDRQKHLFTPEETDADQPGG